MKIKITKLILPTSLENSIANEVFYVGKTKSLLFKNPSDLGEDIWAQGIVFAGIKLIKDQKVLDKKLSRKLLKNMDKLTVQQMRVTSQQDVIVSTLGSLAVAKKCSDSISEFFNYVRKQS